MKFCIIEIWVLIQCELLCFTCLDVILVLVLFLFPVTIFTFWQTSSAAFMKKSLCFILTLIGKETYLLTQNSLFCPLVIRYLCSWRKALSSLSLVEIGPLWRCVLKLPHFFQLLSKSQIASLYCTLLMSLLCFAKWSVRWTCSS